MAITALPSRLSTANINYRPPAVTAPLPAVKKVVVPKSNPAPALPLSKLYTGGYGAGPTGVGGWTYPLGSSNLTATYSTNPSVPSSVVPTPQTSLPVNNNLTGAQAATAPGAGADNPINYQPSIDEIEAAPEYQAALKAYNSSQQSNWNNLLLGLGSRIAQGGYDVSGQLQNALGSDPQYAGLSAALAPSFATAAANPLSDRAQIALAYNRGMQSLPYSVQAQGGYGQSGASGAYAGGAQGLLENQQLQTAQGQNSLLSAISGDLGNYAQLGAQGMYGLQQAREAAASRLSQIPGAAYDVGNYTGTTPNADVPGTQTQPGVQGTGVPSSGYVPISQGGPVVWGGTPYTSVAALTKALAKTGVSYQTWANNHRTAATALARLGA